MLKKLFIGLFVLLLCAGNSGLSQLGRLSVSFCAAWDGRYSNAFAKNWPLTDAEEKAGSESGSASEAPQDDEYLSFKWSSLRLSGSSDLSEHEAKDLFKSIDREIIVPPPRA